MVLVVVVVVIMVVEAMVVLYCKCDSRWTGRCYAEPPPLTNLQQCVAVLAAPHQLWVWPLTVPFSRAYAFDVFDVEVVPTNSKSRQTSIPW